MQIVDCMPIRDRDVDIVRIVKGVRGTVPMRMDLVIRFDNGSVVPWVRRRGRRPSRSQARTPCRCRSRRDARAAPAHRRGVRGRREGDEVPFVLTWFPSHHDLPRTIGAKKAVAKTTAWWQRWSSRGTFEGERSDLVERSAITLKAACAPTGGLIAAPTTSLPEWIGSVRNWDYRYCWLRGATFSLCALARPRARRGSEGVARLAAACARRPAGEGTDHVRTGR